jgi:two-component system NtrC family sensor kinase
MKKPKPSIASLYSILKNDLHGRTTGLRPELSEDVVKEALLKRPSFSVKVRLTLLFLVFFIISAGAAATAIIMVSSIDRRVQYMRLTDRFANEIQHARRSEKNYLLYGSDLSEVKLHLTTAEGLLKQASVELGDVVGIQEIDSINSNLNMYKSILDDLINVSAQDGFRDSGQLRAISEKLRNYGSKMLQLSLDISNQERRVISSTTKRVKTVQAFLLIALPLLSGFIAWHIYRHIILRLNRLMEAMQRFARGDLVPITPRRKYKDEFSQLAIAMNHMMFELEKRQKLLVESHKLRAIGNLTAGIAHELNNPLNNIVLTAAVLKEDYRDLSDEDLQDIANDLVTQGERAQGVVKNLLDFARKSETKTENLHLDQLIKDTLQLAKNQIKLSKIELVTEIEGNVPPVYGDKDLLKEVFLNLFLNAIDAMPEGGRLTVTLKEEKQTGFISVQVSDTGTGIPEHILGSIFSPFFTTKPVGKGTGLGLAVSKSIVEKHGGHIDVESKLDEGATFTVRLPIVPIPADMMSNPE